MTPQESESVMEAVTEAALGELPGSLTVAERMVYANLIRRDVARRLHQPEIPAPILVIPPEAA
jgi:hypothetical protein